MLCAIQCKYYTANCSVSITIYRQAKMIFQAQMKLGLHVSLCNEIKSVIAPLQKSKYLVNAV